MFSRFVTKHACRKGRTDGQNYNSQDRASIAASRGKMNINVSQTFDFVITCAVFCKVLFYKILKNISFWPTVADKF